MRQEVPLKRLLRGYGLTGESLARCLGCSRGTAYSRWHDVGKLTVDELHTIATRAGIPIEDIRNAV